MRYFCFATFLTLNKELCLKNENSMAGIIMVGILSKERTVTLP